MKTILSIPNLNNKSEMINFLEQIYPEQKNHLDKFSFNNILLSTKQTLIWFNSIHSKNFELNPPIKIREHQIKTIFGYDLSNEVIKYMRKNPRQVYKNYRYKKSIFGLKNKSKNINDLDRTMKLWKTIYDREQIKNYELI